MPRIYTVEVQSCGHCPAYRDIGIPYRCTHPEVKVAGRGKPLSYPHVTEEENFPVFCPLKETPTSSKQYSG